MQSQEMSSEAKSELGEEVNSALGMSGGSAEEAKQEHDELPESAKKMLGMRDKRHKKAIRGLQQQIEDLQMRLGNKESLNSQEQPMNQFNQSTGDPGMDDTIYKAVARAMEMQKMQEQKARDAERMQHVQKSYRNLQDTLDNSSEKYEDFDDIVKSEDAPYTDAMRDAALLIENAPDVLYHLGKDREKLKRISQLHPLEQAKEVIKLSQALAVGNGNKQNTASNAKPLGQVKNNPVTSNTVNENTSVGEIRKRMKDGGKRWG